MRHVDKDTCEAHVHVCAYCVCMYVYDVCIRYVCVFSMYARVYVCVVFKM